MMIYGRGHRIKTGFVYALLILFILWAIFPLFLTITTAVKTHGDAFSMPPKFILFEYTSLHFQKIFQESNIFKTYINSILVTLFSVAVSLLVGIPAAYALARFRFRGKGSFTFLLFLTRVFPPIALLVPIFTIWTRMHLMDTLGGLIIIYVQINLSLVIWMLNSFFEDLPKSLEEAAIIDGCTRWGAFFRVLLPLAAPGLAATSVLLMIFSWNEFMFAFALTGRYARTAPVTIYNFMEFEEIQWGQLQAAGFLVTLPVLIFTLLVEKYLVKGLTSGSIK
ncbi:MAG: carbohydrate ABC transporter permease [Spirochaetia bacterium]|nr:carbohydrate ABC transporter permease [Spirochaetia bacterium]